MVSIKKGLKQSEYCSCTKKALCNTGGYTWCTNCKKYWDGQTKLL